MRVFSIQDAYSLLTGTLLAGGLRLTGSLCNISIASLLGVEGICVNADSLDNLMNLAVEVLAKGELEQRPCDCGRLVVLIPLGTDDRDLLATVEENDGFVTTEDDLANRTGTDRNRKEVHRNALGRDALMNLHGIIRIKRGDGRHCLTIDTALAGVDRVGETGILAEVVP